MKIGMSNSPNCSSRFFSFCTFAPYGAEIVACILSENPLELEKQMHERFKDKRLNGEWFDITDEHIKHATSEMVCSILPKESRKKIAATSIFDGQDRFINEYKAMLKQDGKVNKSLLAVRIGISRTHVYSLIKKHGL